MQHGSWVAATQHPHHPKYKQKGSGKSLKALMAIAKRRNDVVYHQTELIPCFAVFHSVANLPTLRKAMCLSGILPRAE